MKRSTGWWLFGVCIVVFLAVNELEYQAIREVESARFDRCVNSMGAVTDMEIVDAIVSCETRLGYIPEDIEWP